MVNVQVLSPLSIKFPSPFVYEILPTIMVKLAPESAVPVNTGVLSLVTRKSTVGIAGGVVSIVSSFTVTSDEELPAASTVNTTTS